MEETSGSNVYNVLFVADNVENASIDQDSAHLRQIIPDEIWELVTKRLKDCPDDLTSLANSSPYFRNMLSPKRTLFLFKEVFNVVAPTVWKNEGTRGLPFSDVFKCREVCSVWNRSVDKLLEQKFSPHELPNSVNFTLSSKTTTNFCPAAEDDDVSKFNSHFEGTHGKPEVSRNPFIWSNLSVRSNNNGLEISDDDQRYLDAVSSALQSYGRHITHFNLKISGFTLFIEDAEKLQEWLTHMPNLKSLIITDETRFLESGLTLSEFQAEIEMDLQPFPKLNSLETVHFKHFQSPMFNPFIQQNYHILSLDLSQCDSEYNFFNLPFPNLTKFTIDIDRAEMYEKFHASCNVPWPMTYYLSITFPDRIRGFRLSQFLHVLQTKFGTSLESIFLQLPRAKRSGDARQLWEDSKNCKLDLPNLTGLHLTLRDPTSLDFLLPTKNVLEELSLEILYPTKTLPETDANYTVVKLNGFENNILDSNIKTIFKKLKEIGILGMEVDEEKWYYF